MIMCGEMLCVHLGICGDLHPTIDVLCVQHESVCVYIKDPHGEKYLHDSGVLRGCALGQCTYIISREHSHIVLPNHKNLSPTR